MIPNSELYTNRVIVNTAFPQRRLSTVVDIGNEEDIDAAKQIILTTIGRMAGILDDPAPQVLVTGLGDFSVLLDVRFWVAPPSKHDTVEAIDQVLQKVKEALDAAGVDMPYPTQQLLVHSRRPAEQTMTP